MSQLESLSKSMNGGNVQREIIKDPITLQSTVNGSLVTVQRNSIAHAELAQGENGMLVKGYNPTNRSSSFGVGVGFNPDGTIKGREHLIQPQATRAPGADVRTISPALAAVRQRDTGSDVAVMSADEVEVNTAELQDQASMFALREAELNQQLAAEREKTTTLQAQVDVLAGAKVDAPKSVKKR